LKHGIVQVSTQADQNDVQIRKNEQTPFSEELDFLSSRLETTLGFLEGFHGVHGTWNDED
jgi:hypothetical protein